MSKFYIVRSFITVARTENGAIGPFDSRALANRYKKMTDKGAQSKMFYEYCYGSRTVPESKLPKKIDWTRQPDETTYFNAQAEIDAENLRKSLKDSQLLRNARKPNREFLREMALCSQIDVNPDNFVALEITPDVYKRNPQFDRKMFYVLREDGTMTTVCVEVTGTKWVDSKEVLIETVDQLDTIVENMLDSAL